MSSVIRQETAVFLLFVLHGALLTLFYDVLRALRRCLRHGLLTLSIEDFLFWLLAGFLTFYLAFRKTDGSIRGYTAAGMLIGFLLYHFTFSLQVVAVLSRIFGLILRAAAFVRHILTIPVRKTCGFCKKRNFLKKTCRFHKKRIEFTRKNDYNKSNDRADRKRLRKFRGVNRKGVNENGRS